MRPDRIPRRGARVPQCEAAAHAIKLADLGLFALLFEEMESAGRGAVELAIMMEALAGGLLGAPVLNHSYMPGACRGPAVQCRHGRAVRRPGLPRVAEGKARLAVAHAEHDESDVSPVATIARATTQGSR